MRTVTIRYLISWSPAPSPYRPPKHGAEAAFLLYTTEYKVQHLGFKLNSKRTQIKRTPTFGGRGFISHDHFLFLSAVRSETPPALIGPYGASGDGPSSHWLTPRLASSVRQISLQNKCLAILFKF